MKPVHLVLLLAASATLNPGHAAERTFGRLFFSAEQRAQLDAGRKDALANLNRPVATIKAEPLPKAAPPKVVTLHGVVKRSDGESTVWVNGKAVSARFGEADIGAGSIATDSVGLDLPGTKRRIRLKVGQSVEATSGTIEEGYRRRRTLPSAVVPADAPAAPDDARASSPTLTPRPAAKLRGDDGEETPDADSGGKS